LCGMRNDTNSQSKPNAEQAGYDKKDFLQSLRAEVYWNVAA